MTQSKSLEHYLTRLDKALGPIAISEKAEILIEIKSHVLEALEKDESQNADAILSSLGEPEQVASRYLLERDLKPQRPPKHPIIKWIVVGFLGTAGISALLVLALVWKFSPIIQVDEEKGRVKILGGLIDVNQGPGSLKFKAGFGTGNLKRDAHRISGSQMIDSQKFKAISIRFTNGEVDMSNTVGNQLRWECDVVGDPKKAQSGFQADVFAVNLDGFDGVDCAFEIPENSSVTLHGINGEIDISEPRYGLKASLINGSVSLDPDDKKAYTYDLKVQNGQVDALESAVDNPKAYPISVAVTNGDIRKN